MLICDRTAWRTPLPPHRVASPSRSSRALLGCPWRPLMRRRHARAGPQRPRVTSTSTVGLPRESRTSPRPGSGECAWNQCRTAAMISRGISMNSMTWSRIHLFEADPSRSRQIRYPSVLVVTCDGRAPATSHPSRGPARGPGGRARLGGHLQRRAGQDDRRRGGHAGGPLLLPRACRHRGVDRGGLRPAAAAQRPGHAALLLAGRLLLLGRGLHGHRQGGEDRRLLRLGRCYRAARAAAALPALRAGVPGSRAPLGADPCRPADRSALLPAGRHRRALAPSRDGACRRSLTGRRPSRRSRRSTSSTRST